MGGEVKEFDGAIDKGLEGVVACTTKISSIQDATLTYRGYTIEDLAEHSTFEEVVFLLWNDRLPKKEELEKLRAELVANMTLSSETVTLMKQLPAKTAVPMDYLRTVVSSLSMQDADSKDIGDDANHRKAMRLAGVMGAIVAGFHRIREGKDIVKPDASKGVAWNFMYMVKGEKPTDQLAKDFDTCLILHADHELNCSAFSARVTTSSLSDMHSAITSAIGTLKGPLHGGANEQVMKMLLRIGSIEASKKFIEDALNAKEKVMGIGHRVYKHGDPRARILRKMSDRLTKAAGMHHFYEMSANIDDIMQEKKGLMPNVDFYSATVYYTMGVPIDLYTPIFAVSRVSGWIAHVLEQYEHNRIYRPRGRYAGKLDQKWTPVDKR
ncbi:MAG: citrate synthase [Deltaproteobacteria bacterium]|nr:citrate synthase [Deltaproteobacteria bacterium]